MAEALGMMFSTPMKSFVLAASGWALAMSPQLGTLCVPYGGRCHGQAMLGTLLERNTAP